MLQQDEDQRQALVNATLKTLGKRRAKVLTEFAERLFSGAPYEDLASYAPAELAELATGTWKFTATRQPGSQKVRVFNPEPADSRVTVVEVVNDNMPFLVDSAMAELQERGYEIRFVLHPIIAVERDGKGQPDGLPWHRAPPANARPARKLHPYSCGRIDSDAERRTAASELDAVFEEVRKVVADWRPMVERLAMRSRATRPPHRRSRGRGSRSDRLSRMDLRRQLHLSRNARIRLCRR
jgi:glutamate dehydrogenase